MSVKVTDHALLDVLRIAGTLPVETLRAALSESLGRAADAAESIKARDYRIVVGGLSYRIIEGSLVSVREAGR
ncbi:hypothetical protein [Methylocystis heyeri]|uniref:Uncharacterized protein n=1 Tax=Methylocystis heyeri TaxID=391905 RepID=A0A6B8KEK0_9HYPH|nr:hypothetical protein [Methylocystis heyeri]QGM46716.1 hypothetical protein H2LOC_014000 [Methylocystis heyeri]